MGEQTALQNYLNETYISAKQRNPAYSVRSFSTKLKMNSGVVSSIMRGQRRVSQKIASRILERLDADPKSKNEVLSLFDSLKYSNPKLRQTKKQIQLSADHFQLISQSIHYEILCLMELKTFKNDSAWISSRLKYSPRQIEEAIGRLERLQMITRSGNEILLTGETYRSSDGIPMASIRQSHFESLEQAKTSLEIDDVDQRDFTSLTFSIDPSRLPAAKKIIREFRKKMDCLFDEGTKSEVYKLSVQLFPLSKPEPNTAVKQGKRK